MIVLREGGNPRNGTAIIEQIKGQRYKSAMGYMVQIDENADASGNYTLLALSDAKTNEENSLTFGLVPVGTFTANDDKHKLPVSDISTDCDTHTAGLCYLCNFISFLKHVNLSSVIYWVGGRPPIAQPPCGFRGEKCISECRH